MGSRKYKTIVSLGILIILGMGFLNCGEGMESESGVLKLNSNSDVINEDPGFLQGVLETYQSPEDIPLNIVESKLAGTEGNDILATGTGATHNGTGCEYCPFGVEQQTSCDPNKTRCYSAKFCRLNGGLGGSSGSDWFTPSRTNSNTFSYSGSMKGAVCEAFGRPTGWNIILNSQDCEATRFGKAYVPELKNLERHNVQCRSYNSKFASGVIPVKCKNKRLVRVGTSSCRKETTTLVNSNNTNSCGQSLASGVTVTIPHNGARNFQCKDISDSYATGLLSTKCLNGQLSVLSNSCQLATERIAQIPSAPKSCTFTALNGTKVTAAHGQSRSIYCPLVSTSFSGGLYNFTCRDGVFQKVGATCTSKASPTTPAPAGKSCSFNTTIGIVITAQSGQTRTTYCKNISTKYTQGTYSAQCSNGAWKHLSSNCK